ncbi:MAG: hypothetical protein ACXV2D_08100 [Halobacteriota archaeon]
MVETCTLEDLERLYEMILGEAKEAKKREQFEFTHVWAAIAETRAAIAELYETLGKPLPEYNEVIPTEVYSVMDEWPKESTKK